MEVAYTATRNYAAPGMTFFQPAVAVRPVGLAGLGALPSGKGFGFLDSIISAVGGAATNIANAFAAGAVAGETTKQQTVIAQSQADIARAQAEAAMYTAQSRTESIKAAAPWVGAGLLGLGIIYVVTR